MGGVSDFLHLHVGNQAPVKMAPYPLVDKERYGKQPCSPENEPDSWWISPYPKGARNITIFYQ